MRRHGFAECGADLRDDGVQRSELQTGDRSARDRYAGAFAAEQKALSQQLGRLGIPLIEATTSESPYQVLQTYYGDRRR